MKKKTSPAPKAKLSHFAATLKAERERLGLTQTEIANVLELNLKTYARWERDENPERKPHILTQEGAMARLFKMEKNAHEDK